jgi:hypothetical protein
MEKSKNTIAAFHIAGSQDGILKLHTSKMYRWHIPKSLRNESIQPGDIVLVRTSRGKSAVLVMQVFREEIEETNRPYKGVIRVLERAPQKEPVR